MRLRHPEHPLGVIDYTDSSRMMGQRAFTELNELCKKNPAMFAPSSSPNAADLELFFPVFMKADYVRGLLDYNKLPLAIEALERRYSPNNTPPKAPITTVDRDVLLLSKRNERQIRFIHRLASLFGFWNSRPHLYSKKEQKRECNVASRALQKAHAALHKVLRDEYFKESIAPIGNLEILLRMEDELPGAARCIREAQPLYPSSRLRDKSNALTRQMVNRVADACFRIYGHCDQQIIEYLAESSWVDFLSSDLKATDLIQRALERKVDQFQRRVPSEDYQHARLTGEWSPSTSVSPPWMDA